MKSVKLSALFILVAAVGVLRADNSEEPESSDTKDAHRAFCGLESYIQYNLTVCLYREAPEDLLGGLSRDNGPALASRICEDGVSDFPSELMTYLESVKSLVLECIRQMEAMA
uniref:Putative secreted protein n=1 Tax=Amblyomma americanum TaxID=6943 RepID=A0A0C9SET2_AMBAM